MDEILYVNIGYCRAHCFMLHFPKFISLCAAVSVFNIQIINVQLSSCCFLHPSSHSAREKLLHLALDSIYEIRRVFKQRHFVFYIIDCHSQKPCPLSESGWASSIQIHYMLHQHYFPASNLPIAHSNTQITQSFI